MTAATLRARPSRAAAPAGLARLLWIEIKRNPVPWVLPLLAVLFFFDTYRTTAGYPPVWTVRASIVPDRLLTDFAPFGASLNGGILALARNVLGLTGIGLATSLATGGLLAWTLPLGYLAFAQYALLQAWRSPWLWPVRPPADHGAWICAGLVFAVGLLAFTVRGTSHRSFG